MTDTTAGAVQGYRALTAASATRTDTPIQEIPQSIQVIPRSVIDDQNDLIVAEDRFHHFICDGLWEEAPLEAELARTADRLVGDSDAVLVIDDTGIPKKGSHSVGVAPQ